MKLEFDISKVSVLSLHGPDEICLNLATPIHGKYEKWNTSALYVRTARGNGEACLRELGWRGEYAYITNAGEETRVIAEGDHPVVNTYSGEKPQIKDLSPAKRSDLARYLRKMEGVID